MCKNICIYNKCELIYGLMLFDNLLKYEVYIFICSYTYITIYLVSSSEILLLDNIIFVFRSVYEMYHF